MLQSMGLQRVEYDLVTLQPHAERKIIIIVLQSMNKMMLLKTQVKNIKCFVFQSICLISFNAIYIKT